ncbi:hypothetical protein ACSW8S_15145 (plasmid) [Clostridium perfringens]
MKIFVTNLLVLILAAILFFVGVIGSTILGEELIKCQNALDSVKLKLEEMIVNKKTDL